MKRRLPALLFFLFICSVIIMADNNSDSIFFDFVRALPYGDKLGHILLYGALTTLMVIALKFKTISIHKKNVQLGSILVLSFTFIEEITQLFLVNRTFDLNDIVSDVIGVVVFTVITTRYVNRPHLWS